MKVFIRRILQTEPSVRNITVGGGGISVLVGILQGNCLEGI